MNNKLVAGWLMVGVLVILAPATVDAQIVWSGAGGDNLWSNPANWVGNAVPTASDRVLINGPAATEPNGPVIEDGIEAVTELLIADFGDPTMTMTGGSLELTGWGTWWGDAAGTIATFNQSGGTVTFTGGPGIMELGWQDSSDPIGSSVGTWMMTGGEIFANGIDLPGKGNGGLGVIELWGGTINVGTARGGLIMYENSRINIQDEGLMILEGDQTATVTDYVDQDWVIAYDGNGEVEIFWDGDFTFVTATLSLACDFDSNQTCDLADLDMLLFDALGTTDPSFDLDGSGGPIDLADRDEWLTLAGAENGAQYVLGDSNLEGRVDATDLNNVALNWLRTDANSWQQGDFNGDKVVNASDLNDLGLNWLHGVAAASAVPEPKCFLMLILGVAGMFTRRRRPRISSIT